MDMEVRQLKLLKALARHHGRVNAIGMGELFRQVYGEPWQHRINDTRKLRKLITGLKKEGVPICSTTDQVGGGYYLASAGSELDDYCRRLHNRAVKILKQEAALRRLALPDLVGRLCLALVRDDSA